MAKIRGFQITSAVFSLTGVTLTVSLLVTRTCVHVSADRQTDTRERRPDVMIPQP